MKNTTRDKQPLGPVLRDIAIDALPELPLPILLTVLLLWIVNITFGFDILYNYFNKTLCSYFDRYQPSFTGLAAYLIGLGYLIFRVLVGNGNKVSQNKFMAKAIDSLFTTVAYNVTALITITVFLNYREGRYLMSAWMLFALGLIWFIIQILRETFKSSKVVLAFRDLSFWASCVVYPALILTFTCWLFMIASHAGSA